MADIVERLRQRPWRSAAENDYEAKERRQREREEGAETITALRAENERLRAALEGYVCICTGGECAEQAGYRDECGKPARAALEEKP